MYLEKNLPDELLREALFLSMEDDDLERRLRRLEEILKDLDEEDLKEEA